MDERNSIGKSGDKVDFHDPNTRLLYLYHKEGVQEAKEELVQNNLNLVWSVVNRFRERGYELDDLFQIGCIGLIKAIEHFELERNLKFSTYAIPMIIGEIKVFLRDDGSIKISRTLKEIANKAIKAKETLWKRTGREPTILEIAEEISISKEEVIEALDAMQPLTSLQEPAYQNDDEISLMERIVNDDQTRYWVERLTVREVLKSLDDIEKRIILLRFFKDLTQSQVAERLKLSQVQVSRAEKKALEKIKKNLAEKG
jgi:RNA polymerase sporulation-specific sigma factor